MSSSFFAKRQPEVNVSGFLHWWHPVQRGRQPTLFQHFPVHGCVWYNVLQALQLAHDERSVSCRGDAILASS
jgi:hypothetical protein